MWADLIIFQFPIYWFNVPGKLKLYMDEVLNMVNFIRLQILMVKGGLMKKRSTSYPQLGMHQEEAFNNLTTFLMEKDVDDILISFHKTMEFCGLKEKKNTIFHNVVKILNLNLTNKQWKIIFKRIVNMDVKE